MLPLAAAVLHPTADLTAVTTAVTAPAPTVIRPTVEATVATTIVASPAQTVIRPTVEATVATTAVASPALGAVPVARTAEEMRLLVRHAIEWIISTMMVDTGNRRPVAPVVAPPVVAPPVAPPPGHTEAHLGGMRTLPADLLKVAGSFANTELTLMIDSGASNDFIDTDFARRCGLVLAPSEFTVRLADGTVVPADGQVTLSYSLHAVGKCAPIPFTSTFTATKLSGYEAILGMPWLTASDVVISWSSRTLEVRRVGRPSSFVEVVERIGDSDSNINYVALSHKGFNRAYRRGHIQELYLLDVTQPGSVAAATESRHPSVTTLLKEFTDVFPDKLPDGLPPVRGIQHRIDLISGAVPPPVRGLHHQSSKDLAVFEEYTRSMIASGQLRVSSSPFGAMALIVRKKDGTARVVVDYRALNELTIKNKYPLPLMDELFDRVHGAKYFSKLDLRTGFHQIRIHDDDVEKTAFRTRYGSFEYRVLPMGLCNAPGTFMQLMNDTFRDLLDRSVLVFLDDILIFSNTLEEHIVHVRQVLERLRSAQLYAKMSKCEFFRSEVEFLGHHIGANGLSVMQDKVASVRDWPVLKNVHDVRSFLGLSGFYRRFVKGYSDIARPLTELTKTTSGVPFVWGKAQESAFAQLKHALTHAPVLLIADPKLPYTLNCDACQYAIGATLQQDQGNGLQPVAYMSRKLKPAEINYDTREKEFLALVDACIHWRQYLHSDHPFTLLSDHDSLKYHKTMPNLSGRLARWIERMSEFNYDIRHIAGVKNVVADALSRRSDLKDDDSSSAVLSVAELRPRGVNQAVVDEAARIHNRAAAELVAPAAANRPAPDRHGVIRMPSQRCTADSMNGTQCKCRTAMGQYCWNHLRIHTGLRIKKSAVAGGGMGLFASKRLPSNFRVDYTGDRVALNGHNGGSYYLEISRAVGIDAARTNAGEGRWINDPRGTGRAANCEFRVYTPRGRPRIGCVRTTRPIEIGEELMIHYGAAYWRYHGAPVVIARNVQRQHGPHAPLPPANIPVDIDVDIDDNDDDATAIDAPSAQLSTITSTVDDPLVTSIRTAALTDATYQLLLNVPTSDTMIHENLLWDSTGTVLYVPMDDALRTRILTHCHDDPTGAHFGRDKTLAAVQQRFRWKGMSSAVDEYVRTCDSCQRNKLSQQATPGLLMPLPLPDRPCDEWTTDAVTGLPMTKRGHDAIQVYVERLCKVKHFLATRKSDGAKEAAAGLVHTVIRPHGVPLAVISDRDPRFTAKYYEELTRLLGVDLRMSTARHPQSDGQSEREIKTLTIALRAYCNDHQDDWDDYLDMIELGFNSAVQSSTGSSPYQLLYGMTPRLPIDVALSSLAPRNPAAIDRVTRMRDAMTVARRHLLDAQQRQSRNASRRSAAHAVGDRVLLSTEGLTLRGFDNKLTSRYVGPFVVTAVVNANAYTLALPPQLQALHSTFNIDKLKRYQSTSSFPTRPRQLSRPPPTAVADSNGDASWEVECITAQRYTGRRTQFLVRWKGYAVEESTWQSRSDLSGALDALLDWEGRD